MKIGISNFVKLNQFPGSGKSFTTLNDNDLVGLVQIYWDKRTPGNGEKTLDRKVIVPIPIYHRPMIRHTINGGVFAEGTFFVEPLSFSLICQLNFV